MAAAPATHAVAASAATSAAAAGMRRHGACRHRCRAEHNGRGDCNHRPAHRDLSFCSGVKPPMRSQRA
jgi:hypothetical protein